MIVTKDERKFLINELVRWAAQEKRDKEIAKQLKNKSARKAALKSKFCVCEAEYILRIMCGEEAVVEAYKRAQELLGAV